MKSLKEKIIKFFGGYTDSDVKLAYLRGKLFTTAEFLKKAEDLYGKNSEDWCKEMYDFISESDEVNYNKYLDSLK